VKFVIILCIDVEIDTFISHLQLQVMCQKLIIAVTGFLFLQCSKKETAAPVLPFESKPVSTAVAPGQMDEVSGITASFTVPGSLWAQQDGGNPAEIMLINEQAVIQKRILLKAAFNRDWEEIASGGGPMADSNYLYIAETGDNNAVYNNYTIYRFIEPRLSTDTIFQYDKINFQYPDGAHDAEAIFVSRQKDIYIITKRDAVSKIYKLPYPQNTGTVTTATPAGQLKFSGVTGAAFSKTKNELLVKTYSAIYYWKLGDNEVPEAAMQRTPLQLGYEPEPQGEAICFQYNGLGFYTLSEKPFFISSVMFNYYKRK
jgi:hypothetical protein